MSIPLTDPADPRVADYRAIPEPELLEARGLFVAEGRLVVERLLRSRRFRTRSLLVTPAVLETLRGAGLLEDRGTPIYVADRATLSAVGGFNFHRGCLALGERGAQPALDAMPIAGPGARTAIVLEGLAQADNVGSVFRNAAAFGAAAVLLGPTCCDPLYRKALRTSVGAALDLPFARLESLAPGLAALRAAGYALAALTPHAPGAIAIDEYVARQAPSRIALLVGTEGAGLSAELEAMADDRVTIPMAEGADSLNVATATGIALHCLWRVG